MIDGTLLDVEAAQDELCLRLDTNHLWREQEEAAPIATVRLSGCGDVQASLERLRPYVGTYLSVEALEDAEIVVGAFLELNYGADDLQVPCRVITQEHREYTAEELRRRCQWLREECRRSEDARFAAERRQAEFTAELTKMVDGEWERCRRKQEFFQPTKPEQAWEMQGRMAAYERVRTWMEQLRKHDQGEG